MLLKTAMMETSISGANNIVRNTSITIVCLPFPTKPWLTLLHELGIPLPMLRMLSKGERVISGN